MGIREEILISKLSKIGDKVNINKLSPDIELAIKRKIDKPDDFDWTGETITIYKDNSGNITTDLNASSYQHVGTGKVYYVNLIDGLDTNDGLTPETALKSVYSARAKADVDIIEVAEGFYDDMYSFNNLTVNKNITIVGAEGANVILSTRRSLTWSKTVDKTNVYQVSRTSVASVWDSSNLDANGDYTKLTPVDSIDDVDATPNSYYYTTPNLYVHTFDGRQADSSVTVFLDLGNFKNTGNYRTYFENIKFYGGNVGCVAIAVSSETDTTMFVANNCEFKYSNAGNGGLQALGCDVILKNCVASKNKQDGFNYHMSANRVNKAIEDGCTGRSSGIDRGTDTDNGSTMHDGGRIIRVNGTYCGNEGPNIHDINNGTESWNIGCKSYNSVATASIRNTNFMIEDMGEMWLDSCEGFDSFGDINISATATMHLTACDITNGNNTVSGNIYSY